MAVLARPFADGVARVALYAALSDELPSRPLFDALRPAVRELCLPRVDGRDVVFHRVETWDDLVPGARGVLEPRADAPRVQLGAGDLAFLPGVAFDLAGRRLGRGGGHYDRAFPAEGVAPRLVGLAFDLQIVDAVPVGSRDRRVDAIVTPRGVHRVRGAGSE